MCDVRHSPINMPDQWHDACTSKIFGRNCGKKQLSRFFLFTFGSLSRQSNRIQYGLVGFCVGRFQLQIVQFNAFRSALCLAQRKQCERDPLK